MKRNLFRNYEGLYVWQKSIDFVAKVYKATEGFPSTEIYGLTNQIRRAVVSIPSNIAEESGRKGVKELLQFLHIALGSCSELHTQFIIAKNLGYSQGNSLIDGILEIKKMLIGYMNKVKKEGFGEEVATS